MSYQVLLPLKDFAVKKKVLPRMEKNLPPITELENIMKQFPLIHATLVG